MAWVALLLVVAGCTTGAGPGRPVAGGLPSPGTAAEYRPVRAAHPGGTATVGTWLFPARISPFFATEPGAVALEQALFNGLVAVDSSLAWYGDLAREVPTTANGGVRLTAAGMDVTYALRSGLSWSDGLPLTADDVLFTLQVITGPAAAAGFSQEGYDRITAAEAAPAGGVTFHFGSVYPAYLNLFSLVLPRHRLGLLAAGQLAADSYWAKPDVVSGPFTLQELVAGDHAILVRNPAYADGRSGMAFLGHAAHLDRLVFRGYDSRQAVLAAAKAGDVATAFDLTEQELATVAGLRGLQVRLVPALQYEQVSFNQAAPTAPWAGDPRLLEALDLAADRPGLVSGPLGGRSPLTATPIDPALPWARDRALEAPSYDLAGARRLLDADGWTAGSDGNRSRAGRRLQFTLSTTTDQRLRASEEDVLVAGWRKAGADARITNFTAAQMFAGYDAGGVLARGRFEAALWAWITPPDPDSEFGVLHSSSIPAEAHKQGQNYSRCHDPALDQALAAGRATLDPARRSAAYRSFEAAYVKARCELPLYRRLAIGVSSPRLHNLSPNPAPVGNAWNVADWWLEG